MAPPSKQAKLSQVDPARLSREVQTAVDQFGRGEDVSIDVLTLCGLAQGALKLSPVQGGITVARVAHVVFHSPYWQQWPHPDVDANPSSWLAGNWRDELLLVLRAVSIRFHLLDGHAISAHDLSVLGSVSLQWVKKLIEAGSLRATQGDDRVHKIKAKDAIKWLKERET